MQEMKYPALSEEEFWTLFSVGMPWFVQFAQKWVKDRMNAEDTVMEAAVSVVRQIRRGGGPTEKTFISYMRVVIHNGAIDALRVASREVSVANIEELAESEQSISVGEEASTVGDIQLAHTAFNMLPARAQTLLMLCDVCGLKSQEVAESQGMTLQAVISARFRARQNLRTNYLLAAVDELEKCKVMKVTFLASYARGMAPLKRCKNISRHLQSCEVCRTNLSKMQAVNLPVFSRASYRPLMELRRRYLADSRIIPTEGALD